MSSLFHVTVHISKFSQKHYKITSPSDLGPVIRKFPPGVAQGQYVPTLRLLVRAQQPVCPTPVRRRSPVNHTRAIHTRYVTLHPILWLYARPSMSTSPADLLLPASKITECTLLCTLTLSPVLIGGLSILRIALCVSTIASVETTSSIGLLNVSEASGLVSSWRRLHDFCTHVHMLLGQSSAPFPLDAQV